MHILLRQLNWSNCWAKRTLSGVIIFGLKWSGIGVKNRTNSYVMPSACVKVGEKKEKNHINANLLLITCFWAREFLSPQKSMNIPGRTDRTIQQRKSAKDHPVWWPIEAKVVWFYLLKPDIERATICNYLCYIVSMTPR